VQEFRFSEREELARLLFPRLRLRPLNSSWKTAVRSSGSIHLFAAALSIHGHGATQSTMKPFWLHRLKKRQSIHKIDGGKGKILPLQRLTALKICNIYAT
jgi:hypothetical protein